jgi:hypothetical protein
MRERRRLLVASIQCWAIQFRRHDSLMSISFAT